MAGVEFVREAIVRQATACEALGSPFTARLLDGSIDWIGSADPVARLIAAWPTDPFSDALALRLSGALHALVLTGQAPALARHYPGEHPATSPGDLADLWPAAQAVIEAHEAFVTEFLTHPPQTNEVGRAAPIMAGLQCALAQFAFPVALLEAGASAGLNLNFDRFSHKLGTQFFGSETSSVRLSPAWQGASPPANELQVVDRQGCDIAPVDVSDKAQRVRLSAYIWPDQPERLARLGHAMEIGQHHRAPVARQAIGNWLEHVLAPQRPGVLTFLYHTVVWQYLDGFEKAAAQASIRAAGQRATVDAPLARLAMEWNPVIKATDIHLTLWPGGDTKLLGHAHAHGTWMEWLG
ncbi:MAG: DUF2332 domain-containing protein [Alphaproteobacteria bacterium]